MPWHDPGNDHRHGTARKSPLPATPIPSQDPAPMADSAHPGRCCHAARRIWTPSLPGSFPLSLSCNSQTAPAQSARQAPSPVEQEDAPQQHYHMGRRSHDQQRPRCHPPHIRPRKIFLPVLCPFRPLSCIDMGRRNVYDYILNFVEQFQHITRQICSPIAARP